MDNQRQTTKGNYLTLLVYVQHVYGQSWITETEISLRHNESQRDYRDHLDGATPRKILFPPTSNRDPRLVAGKHTNTLWEMNTVSTVDTIRNVEMSQVLQNIGSTLETRRPTEIRDGNFESLEDDTNGPSEGGEDRLIENDEIGRAHV